LTICWMARSTEKRQKVGLFQRFFHPCMSIFRDFRLFRPFLIFIVGYETRVVNIERLYCKSKVRECHLHFSAKMADAKLILAVVLSSTHSLTPCRSRAGTPLAGLSCRNPLCRDESPNASDGAHGADWADYAAANAANGPANGPGKMR